MTKRRLIELLATFDEEEELDEYELSRLFQDEEEARLARIEEIEERQHQSGFYTFQDQLDMYRRER